MISWGQDSLSAAQEELGCLVKNCLSLRSASSAGDVLIIKCKCSHTWANSYKMRWLLTAKQLSNLCQKLIDPLRSQAKNREVVRQTGLKIWENTEKFRHFGPASSSNSKNDSVKGLICSSEKSDSEKAVMCFVFPVSWISRTLYYLKWPKFSGNKNKPGVHETFPAPFHSPVIFSLSHSSKLNE